MNVEPEDRTSDVRTTPIRIFVGRQGPAPDDAETQALIGTVSLKTDDGRNVEFTSTLVPADPDASFQLRLIEITPTTALESRWHTLTVSIPADKLALTDNPETDVVSRFHPEHAPTLQRVFACPNDGAWRVEVFMSQNVAFDAQPANLAAMPLKVVSDGLDCTPRPNYVPSSDVESEMPETSSRSFSFDCESKTTRQGVAGGGFALSVDHEDELKSPDGATFSLVPGKPELNSVTFEPSDAYPMNDGCLWWFAP